METACVISTSIDSQLLKMAMAEIHVFSDSVFCYGKGDMNEALDKLTKRWIY